MAAAVTLTVTALSATVDQIVGPGPGGAGWPAFFGGTARTGLIVFITVLTVETVRTCRSRGMVGHCEPEPDQVSLAEIIGDEITEITPLADHVYAMKSLARYEAELDDAFVRVDDLRWLLANYIIKGGRVRRLIGLSRLLAGPSDGEQGSELRRTAASLLQAIRNTNTDVAEWLLTHRVAVPNPDLLDSNTLLGRHLAMSIDPMTVSADPLYLLICHIHDVLEVAESLSDLEHPVVEDLETGLVRPLDAIERELSATMAFNAAVLSTARTVRTEAA